MRERSFRASVDELERVKGFIEEELGPRVRGGPAAMRIMLAVDELFTNIAEYAYGPSESGSVVVRLDLRRGPPATAEITFLDSGKPCNPLLREDPDVTLPGDRRQVGGLGIFLVKKYMDSVRYAYEGGRNILTIRKTL